MAPKAKLVAFHPVHGYKIKPPQDLKTIKRNERERKRVETVNKGFETLRQHVPAAADYPAFHLENRGPGSMRVVLRRPWLLPMPGTASLRRLCHFPWTARAPVDFDRSSMYSDFM